MSTNNRLHRARSLKFVAGKMASVKAACEALGLQRISQVGALLTWDLIEQYTSQFRQA